MLLDILDIIQMFQSQQCTFSFNLSTGSIHNNPFNAYSDIKSTFPKILTIFNNYFFINLSQKFHLNI